MLDSRGNPTIDADVLLDNGAYTSWGPTIPVIMMRTTSGHYRVPVVAFEAQARMLAGAPLGKRWLAGPRRGACADAIVPPSVTPA